MLQYRATLYGAQYTIATQIAFVARFVWRDTVSASMWSSDNRQYVVILALSLSGALRSALAQACELT